MSTQAFPIVNVDLGGLSSKKAIQHFLEHRPSERWVLLGEHAAQSVDQLWTAWIQATRNELRGCMVARSIDAEFLRYLAGTHHISEAFARAGLQSDQSSAWVLCLPTAEGVENDLGHVQPIVRGTQAFSDHLEGFLESLGWPTTSSNVSFSIEGSQILGIDVQGWEKGREFESLIAHVLMADDQSSSHR
ncbi:MAG: hypothetical protein CMA15_03585 [Euryarchaeota archaeon]|nr:hypothetical protein [Euryarchaeota archaeon]